LSGLANPLPSDWGFFPAPASPAFRSLPHHTLFYMEITRKATKFLCPQSYITHALSTPSISRASKTLSAGRISANKTLLRACQQVGTHVHTSVGLVPKQAPPSMNKGCVTLWPCHFTLKIILRQKKKNYGNTNVSPCKNIILRKSSKRNKNP
jgi:hypothetical protein